MNTNNEDQAVTYNSAYDPFPEPQTIPAGWDTSAFSFVPLSDSTTDEDKSTQG